MGLSLKDQGFRFCLSPDAVKGRWLHPVEVEKVHPDWIDVTDWPDKKLEKFLMDKLPKQAP
uniref:Uncharacterized protein n=1 Tax=viral metagenome TaxID=1070528 RepID=A0A6M3MIE3_9ZZZZ